MHRRPKFVLVLYCLYGSSGQSVADKLTAENVSIEVSEIPPEATEETLTVMFESRRVTGISEASVSKVVFFTGDHSRAIITFTDAEGK